MEPGDTLKFTHQLHLWVVVSDPKLDPNQVLIVNMSTDRGVDQSCIISPGEHPFVRHATCMRYDMSRVTSNASLETLLSRGSIQLGDPVSSALLQRIRDGASVSQHIPLACKQVLIAQDLIDP